MNVLQMHGTTIQSGGRITMLDYFDKLALENKEEVLVCPKCGAPLAGSYMVQTFANHMTIDKYQRIGFANREGPLDADIDESELYDLMCYKSGCNWSLRKELGNSLPSIYDKRSLPKEAILERIVLPMRKEQDDLPNKS
jgi:hypothetical protein